MYPFYHQYLESALEIYMHMLVQNSEQALLLLLKWGWVMAIPSMFVLSGVANRKQQHHVSSFSFVSFSPTHLPLSSGLTCLLLVALWFERLYKQATSAFFGCQFPWQWDPSTPIIFFKNMLESATKYNSVCFCLPPFPVQLKTRHIDVTLSVCLQLIHHQGTGDLLDAKHPGLLYLTTASNHLYSSWSWEAVSRPIVQSA